MGTVDDRTGLIVVEGKLDHGHASAEMTLNTFFRAGVPVPTRSTIAEHLPPSDALSGRNVLIVGSSRGLGAALCGAFVSQGARVGAGFARSWEDAERLRAEFGADRIELLQFDAEPETLDELSRILRITDGVMRHMATRRLEGSQTSPPPEPEPTVPAPAYAETNTSSQEEE